MVSDLPTSTEILGVKVDRLMFSELMAQLVKEIEEKKKLLVVTPNPEVVLLASEDEEYRKILNSADIAIPDGFGLVLASYILWIRSIIWHRQPHPFPSPKRRGVAPSPNRRRVQDEVNGKVTIIPQQISGDMLMLQLIKVAARRSWRVFLLGGKAGVAEKASQKLTTNYQLPATNIQVSSGSPNIAHETKSERKSVLKAINQFRPHLLFVAYGAPWQEKWLAANWKNLRVNLAMGVGGTLDEIAGVVSPTPRIFRQLKLRWLWRLVTQPKRWRRIWRAAAVFPWKVLTS